MEIGKQVRFYIFMKWIISLKLKKVLQNSCFYNCCKFTIYCVTVCSLVRKFKQQAREQMEERRPDLVKALNQMGDFYMELKWDFQSWIPLVSKILPSDLCKIHKKGSSIRLDTTLVDFNDMRWERGDISFIFNGNAKPNYSLTVLDNKANLYQRVKYEESEVEIEDEVDILMSSDIMAAQMSTKSISFTRAQTGWIFREARKEMVGGFQANFYVINGMLLESRKRREHLTEEDLQKNKAIMESFTKGSATGLDSNGEVSRTVKFIVTRNRISVFSIRTSSLFYY